MTDKIINIKCTKGFGSYTTDKISKEINALILNCPTKSHIKITSDLGYILFDSKECESIMYIPLRVQGIDSTHKRINFSFDKYSINEKLLIEVNQTIVSSEPVRIIIR